MTSHATLCLVLATALTPLAAQGIKSLSQSEAIRRAYAPICKRANRSVVDVHVDDDLRVLGTAVGKDLVVTKLSELGVTEQNASDESEIKCHQGDRSWTCRLLGFDRAADLALLRTTGAPLIPVEWQTEAPAPGAFLASPDGSTLPLGVGILAAAPYVHTRPRAFLGIRFANPTGGPARLDEALEHGAARAAGLRPGDVIIHFDGQEIADSDSLREQILQHNPGDEVEVRVRRDDQELTFDVTLGTNNSSPTTGQEQIWGRLSKVRSGFQQVLQHDTVLEPGDCGGPVVDLTGKALGINIARAGRVETLALPADEVMALLEKLTRPAGRKRDQ